MKIYFYSEEKGIYVAEGELCDEIYVSATICLGGFDGIHKGHKTLFSEARKYGKWGVLLFDRNVKGNENLTSLEEKINLIEENGADFIIIVEFTDEFSKKAPEEFVDFMENTLRVSHIVCGYDYRFGYKASGDSNMLKNLCKSADVSVLDAVKMDGEPIKSTHIRDLVKIGDVKKACELLGQPYSITGIVEKGLKNGRKMGFPTANIKYPDNKLLPNDGVYYGKVMDMDAVINIGKNPTFNAENRTVEAHIPQYSGNLYGKEITIRFIEKIRDDKKFDSIDDLILQINKDIEYVKGRAKNGKENAN